MTRITVAKNFYLDEFVPKEIYMQFYEKSIMFVNPSMISMAQGLRTYFNVPIGINDWWTGGSNNYNGFRPSNHSSTATLSQHYLANAIDARFPKGTDYDKIRQTIRDKYETFRVMGITTMELNTYDHLHVDCRNTTGFKEGLYEVTP